MLAVIAASQHLHAAKTNLITAESPSKALVRYLHLAWRSVQFGFTHRLRDGKNHIYYGDGIGLRVDSIVGNSTACFRQEAELQILLAALMLSTGLNLTTEKVRSHSLRD
ncbi:MAG: hypothetical protein ACYS30_20625 [Planctomycetota bacterium]